MLSRPDPVSGSRTTLDDQSPDLSVFRADTLNGLRCDPKRLSSKYLYDETGSELFEKICDLPEYYVTRTELALLRTIGPDLRECLPTGAALVEFGAGSTLKIRLILEALDAPAAYVPIDISGDHLHAQSRSLAEDMPEITIRPICADFTQSFSLPGDLGGEPVGLFPGSTIGNLEIDAAVGFLKNAASLLGPDRLLLIGTDLEKDEDILIPAYDDAAGITAAFNLNLLDRMNRELGADFDRDRFRHTVRYNRELKRIEMHLESLADQTVTVAGERFAFATGETIHTENSHKYSVDRFQAMAKRAGFGPERVWTDADGLFAIHLLRVQ